MTPAQLRRLLVYIKANNSWGDEMFDINCIRHRKAIKYVNCSFDSRDGSVWKLEFMSITGEPDKSFRIESQKDIKAVYDWLNEPYMI